MAFPLVSSVFYCGVEYGRPGHSCVIIVSSPRKKDDSRGTMTPSPCTHGSMMHSR